MNDLQKLVSGILNDLINARYEADAVAAEYTRLYRDDPVMQAMNAPMLNISNVSVDLRLAFAAPDDSDGGGGGGRSDVLTKEVVGKEADILRDRVFEKAPLPANLTGPRLAGAKRVMSTRLSEAMVKHSDSPPPVRKAAMAESVVAVLEERNVKLSRAQMKAIERDIDRSANKVATATAITKAAGDGRKVLTGTEELSKLNPEAISSIKFDVDLDQMRWIDVADDDAENETNAKDGRGGEAVLGGN